MRVFLIHGMGRTPISMWWLRARMRRAGHLPSLFGYTVTVSNLEQITDRFVEHVHRVLAEEGDGQGPDARTPYAIVGHSLGTTITRLASPRLPGGFCRFAMLAPPNHTPVMARALRDNAFYRAATQTTGQQLAEDDFFESLPMPDVPSIIIAGTRGPRAPWLPFGGEPNDSILRVAETRLPGVETFEVPGVHTFLMNRRDVFEILQGFLGPHNSSQSRGTPTASPRASPEPS